MIRPTLVLNTLAETAIAIGMFSMPAAFFPGAAGLSAAIARAFSFAILAVAFISLTALRKGASPQTVKNVIVILTVYHLAQLLAQFVNAAMFPPLLIPPVVIHVVFSTLFIGAWVRSSRNVARPDHVRRASMPAELT